MSSDAPVSWLHNLAYVGSWTLRDATRANTARPTPRNCAVLMVSRMGTALAGFRFDGTCRAPGAPLEACACVAPRSARRVRRIFALDPGSARGGHDTKADSGRVLHAHQHRSAVRGSHPGDREASE